MIYSVRKKIDAYLYAHYSSHYIITPKEEADNSIFFKIYDIENDESFWVEFDLNGDFINAIYSISPDQAYKYYKSKNLI
jgi:hypothetical protein